MRYSATTRSVSSWADVSELRLSRVNLLQDGRITLDKRSSETSAQELTDLVVAEYRKALLERQRAEGELSA